MSTVKCSCCGVTDESHRVVSCGVCRKNYKISCVDLSNAEARKIHSKSSGLSWACSSCAQLGDDLVSLRAAIVSLQNEVKELKSISRQSVMPTSVSLIDIEKVVQEVADRDRRKTNVIVYGCMESSCKTNNEQIVLDGATVDELLPLVHLKDADYSLSRLGKFIAGGVERPRPLRITFTSESCVSSLLKHANDIRRLQKWNKLSFSRDRTELQRDLYRNTRKELDDRLRGGETGLAIKYKNGVPTIVSTGN